VGLAKPRLARPSSGSIPAKASNDGPHSRRIPASTTLRGRDLIRRRLVRRLAERGPLELDPLSLIEIDAAHGRSPSSHSSLGRNRLTSLFQPQAAASHLAWAAVSVVSRPPARTKGTRTVRSAHLRPWWPDPRGSVDSLQLPDCTIVRGRRSGAGPRNRRGAPEGAASWRRTPCPVRTNSSIPASPTPCPPMPRQARQRNGPSLPRPPLRD